MGIAPAELDFLLHVAKRGVRFDQTLLLGRQQFFRTTADSLVHSFGRAGTPVTTAQATALLKDRDGYAEDLFTLLGAGAVRSLDASTYEGATDIHDLNEPLPPSDPRRASFSAVVDGGTLEHVFNFPEALRTAMQLVALDGHLLMMTPTNDQDGHGFYQLSPEILFRAIGPENGFMVEHCFVKEDHGHWYLVKDPAAVGQRIEFRTRHSATLFLAARRTEVRDVFATWPQQSDYSEAWNAGSGATAPSRSRGAGLAARARWLYRPAVKLRARYLYPPQIGSRPEQFTKVAVNGDGERKRS
ncbi:MAG: hypothetical protein U0W40_00365 [Acidimicrobiia bacterium]